MQNHMQMIIRIIRKTKNCLNEFRLVCRFHPFRCLNANAVLAKDLKYSDQREQDSPKGVKTSEPLNIVFPLNISEVCEDSAINV
jgi:hypothetical protein